MQLQTGIRGLALLASFAVAPIRPVSIRSNIQNMFQFPLSSTDRRIDELGEEARIQSEPDAEAYVGAFLEKFKLNEVEPRVVGMWKARLARAELDALRHPEKRIPEEAVAETFNQLMDRWNGPAWTRISVEELHVLRAAISVGLFPRSMPRSSGGEISRNCRPTEALYLMYLLQSRGGVPVELTKRVNAGDWLEAMPEDCEPLAAPMVRLKVDSSPDGMHRLGEYFAARANYFANHPDRDFEKEVYELFRKFHVD
jgi:hypothetical protein